MKTRSGFVSNSSSTSFTCDICGESQSGWDLSRSDAGMKECRSGHTFCDEHELTPVITDDRKREVLIASREKYRDASWKKPGDVDAEIAEINAYTSGELEDAFDEYNNDDGCVPDFCPVCQMENVDAGDIVAYALVKFGFKDRKELAKALKDEFKTYDAFKEYLKNNRKA